MSSMSLNRRNKIILSIAFIQVLISLIVLIIALAMMHQPKVMKDPSIKTVTTVELTSAGSTIPTGMAMIDGALACAPDHDTVALKKGDNEWPGGGTATVTWSKTTVEASLIGIGSTRMPVAGWFVGQKGTTAFAVKDVGEADEVIFIGDFSKPPFDSIARATGVTFCAPK